ncbi:MAG: hypothetical protein ACTH07_05450 [Microbacterium sp.]
MDDLEKYRRQLRDVGAEMARQEELKEQRAHLVDEARKAGMTMREAADLLQITETGLRKAQAAHRRRLQEPTALAR